MLFDFQQMYLALSWSGYFITKRRFLSLNHQTYRDMPLLSSTVHFICSLSQHPGTTGNRCTILVIPHCTNVQSVSVCEWVFPCHHCWDRRSTAHTAILHPGRNKRKCCSTELQVQLNYLKDAIHDTLIVIVLPGGPGIHAFWDKVQYNFNALLLRWESAP